MGEFPEDVERFLRDQITSVEQLEVLLLLRKESARTWNAEEVGREIYTGTPAAAQRLADLQMLKLLARVEEPPGRYRYAPESAEQARVVDRLADVYKERRVAVIEAIYSRPSSQVQAFADAFRFRKKE